MKQQNPPSTLPNLEHPLWDHEKMFGNIYGPICKSYFHNTSIFGSIGMHCHKFYEINIVTSGTGKHYVDNQIFDASVGDVFLIQPMIQHGYWSVNDMQIFHLCLSEQFFFEI